MRTEAEIEAEIERRLREYKALQKGYGHDPESDNEMAIEAEACMAELRSIRHFLIGK